VLTVIAKILLIILDAVYWILAPAALLRFYMQLLSVSFRNPIGQFVRAVTDWIILPLRRVFKGVGYDWASLIAAYLFELLYIFLGTLILVGILPYTRPVGIAGLFISAVFGMAVTVMALMMVVLIAYIVLSWVARGQTSVSDLLEAMVRPWLRPIRRYMPLVGGIDLSPIVLSVVLQIAIVILKSAQAAVLGLL